MSTNLEAIQFAVAGSEGVKLWSTTDWRLIRTIEAIEDEGVSLTDNGSHVAVAGREQKVQVYNVQTGLRVASLNIEREAAGEARLYFTGDGNRLVGGFIASPFHWEWVWRRSTFIRQVCNRLGTGLPKPWTETAGHHAFPAACQAPTKVTWLAKNVGRARALLFDVLSFVFSREQTDT